MRPVDPYLKLTKEIEAERLALLAHPVYERASAVESLRLFMESHVFAVWDFMSLLKALQRRLSCVDVPWLPPRDNLAARLVNEIVLGEETDEVAPGRYLSHFELYLAAMEEIGADRAPILRFVESLSNGAPAERALAALAIPEPTKQFTRATLRTAARAEMHEVAASFLLGREDLVPEMFRRILARLGDGGAADCPSFRLYLDRHIHLDEERHAPMGERLLRNLCGSDPLKWAQATGAARAALVARHLLWDGVLETIACPPSALAG